MTRLFCINYVIDPHKEVYQDCKETVNKRHSTYGYCDVCADRARTSREKPKGPPRFDPVSEVPDQFLYKPVLVDATGEAVDN